MKLNLNKNLTIRLTEIQFRKLSSHLVEEEISKSQFIREAIELKLASVYRNNLNDEKSIRKFELMKLILKSQ